MAFKYFFSSSDTIVSRNIDRFWAVQRFDFILVRMHLRRRSPTILCVLLKVFFSSCNLCETHQTDFERVADG